MPNHLQKIAAFSPEAEKTTVHGVVLEHLLHAESQARKAAPHVGVASRQPYPHARGDRNHRRSRASTMRRSASTSTPASTMTRRPLVNSTSIRCSVESAGALRDESAADGTGLSSATTALTKPASDWPGSLPSPSARSPAENATDHIVAPLPQPDAARTCFPKQSAPSPPPTSAVAGPSPPLQVDSTH